jgi:hypothetical protein
MPRFFNKFRVDAIRNSKVFNYILYAIGEILLVTIGILIAVSINNKNENRKQVKELQAIYTAVENDLTIDSLFLHKVIEAQKEVDSMTQVVLSQETLLVSIDTITEENVKDCKPCRPYHVNYSPFTPNLKGFEALKNFENNLSDPQDSLTLKILELYSRNVGLIDVMGNRVGDHLMESLSELEKEPWYVSFVNRKFNKEVAAYFISDLGYRNRLATFSLLNSNNYMTFIKDYQRQSREVINDIQKSRGALD